MSKPNSSVKPNQPLWFRFSLRSILILMLLVATYIAGWLSHRQFHNRNLDENIATAVKRIETKQTEFEIVDELGISIVKGKTAQDVSDVISVIEQVKNAAQK